MKTKILNMLLLLAVSMGFAACNDDTEPVLNELEPGNVTSWSWLGEDSQIVLDKNASDEIVLSIEWVAPTFNINVARSYRIELCNTEDFAAPISVAVTNGTSYNVTAAELNEAVLKYMPSVEDVSAIDVFVRVRCELNSDPNWVMPLAGYLPINVTPYPGEYPRLYVVGSLQNWNINESAYFLRCTTGDNVYTGQLGLLAGAQFRFYSSLGNWDEGSYGSQVEDAGVNISLETGLYEGSLFSGKGSWIIDREGTYNCTVDIVNMTVKFEYAGEYQDTAEEGDGGEDVEIPSGCFVVGNINNWSVEPTATEGAMTETSEGSGVWSGTFAFPDSGNGLSYFRIYTSLSGDYNTGQYGGTIADDENNQQIEITDGYAEVEIAEGSSTSFMVPTGIYLVTVDFNSNMMTIENAE